MQQYMACENTMQLWMEDHKRVTDENQNLRRELKERDYQWKNKMEATDCWMRELEEKHNQQEENSKFLEVELIMKDEMIAKMMEELRTQKQEKEALEMQNLSMMMTMQAEAEEQVQREEDERKEREETQAQLKRSEEARGALKAEVNRLRDLLSAEEGEQRKSAQCSIIGAENLKKLGERITKETERIKAKLAFRKQRIESQIIDSTIKTIKSSFIKVEEEVEERKEQEDETREYSKREAETEITEEREEIEHDNREENTMKTDDLKTLDDSSSKMMEQKKGKPVYEAEIEEKVNLGGKNGSNIGAKKREMSRATKIRPGREKEVLDEAWKWIMADNEVGTVCASKKEKKASKGHDLMGQDRIGKPKVKIKSQGKEKWLIVAKNKNQHGDEQDGLKKIMKIERKIFLLVFWLRLWQLSGRSYF